MPQTPLHSISFHSNPDVAKNTHALKNLWLDQKL